VTLPPKLPVVANVTVKLEEDATVVDPAVGVVVSVPAVTVKV
jgi:hypothetical protein